MSDCNAKAFKSHMDAQSRAERDDIELADRDRSLGISVDELIDANDDLRDKLDRVRGSAEKMLEVVK